MATISSLYFDRSFFLLGKIDFIVNWKIGKDKILLNHKTKQESQLPGVQTGAGVFGRLYDFRTLYPR